MAWFYYSFDFVINSFTRLSERQRTWWQIALKSKAYRFKKVTILCVCERAVVLWGSKLSNKPYFALKLWYREERPFGIHDNPSSTSKMCGTVVIDSVTLFREEAYMLTCLGFVSNWKMTQIISNLLLFILALLSSAFPITALRGSSTAGAPR